MTMIGKSRPVRTAALRLSSANRCSRPATSLAETECLDIFSPAPGDREVISQALRDSSIETKIAPRSVRIAACAGRGASLSIIGSRVGASATSLSRSEGRQPNAHRILRRWRPRPDRDCQLVPQDYPQRLSGRSEPDRQWPRRPGPKFLRELRLWRREELYRLLQQGLRSAGRAAIDGSGPDQAQRDRLGHRAETGRGRSPADPVPWSCGYLLEATRQRTDDND